jgi:CubicO group peptidase (beta-lactamase class C family)
MYSSTADMARYLSALLNGGTGEQGSILEPDTLASMFEPHFQLDPRAAGMGLGFEPNEESGHRTIWKTGIVSGFASAMVVAPDDGIGVVVLGNTGGLDGRCASEPLAGALLRRLLALPDQPIRTHIPPRPETWREICGWYSPDPGPVTNLFMRALWGAAAEVVVRGGHLVLKPLTPVPALRRGMRLYPDDPDDPYVFRVEIPEYGKNYRVVFARGPGGEETDARLLLEVMSFRKRPDARNPRRLANAALLGGASLLAGRRLRARAGAARARKNGRLS